MGRGLVDLKEVCKMQKVRADHPRFDGFIKSNYKKFIIKLRNSWNLKLQSMLMSLDANRDKQVELIVNKLIKCHINIQC
jgi:hypothetical protein